MSVKGALIAAGVRPAIATAEAPRAEKAMREFDITTQKRAEQWLAQVLHESGGLRYFEEIASGAAYEGRRDLGNIHPGDGRRYKGRGPIQLTGRANYRAAGKALGLPLEDQPTLAAHHDVGWRIAGYFWHAHGLNAPADRGDIVAITHTINGGENGLASRRAYLAIVQRVDCRPVDSLAGYTAAEIRWIREYDKLRRANKDPRRRAVLRIVMRQQRKRIWSAAQPEDKGGDGRDWSYGHRRERYNSLLARST